MTGKLQTLIMIITSGLIFLSCDNPDEDLLKKMAEMENGGNAEALLETDEKYNELKRDIAEFQPIIDEKIDAADKLGTYYKLIGLKYLDYTMYHLALESFQKALEFYPENPNVLYYAGMCSARLYKTEGSPVKADELLNQAVRYYEASIAANNRYSSPMYGLAVLYTYELDLPDAAIPLLEMYNTIQKSSLDGRFVLAAAHFKAGNEDKAVEIYDQIIGKADDPDLKEAARNNRNEILRGGGNG